MTQTSQVCTSLPASSVKNCTLYTHTETDLGAHTRACSQLHRLWIPTTARNNILVTAQLQLITQVNANDPSAGLLHYVRAQLLYHWLQPSWLTASKPKKSIYMHNFCRIMRHVQSLGLGTRESATKDAVHGLTSCPCSDDSEDRLVERTLLVQNVRTHAFLPEHH